MSGMVRFFVRTSLATAAPKVAQLWVSATAIMPVVTIAVIFGIRFYRTSATAWRMGAAA
jgi:hypothetical protein